MEGLWGEGMVERKIEGMEEGWWREGMMEGKNDG